MAHLRWAEALLLASLAACSAGRVPQDTERWPVKCSRNCRGEDLCRRMCVGAQTQTHRCSGLAACPAPSRQCPPGEKPEPCKLAEWSEWSAPVGCSGLCVRTRNVSAFNRCGGEPCRGALEESRRCANPCQNGLVSRDCSISAWSEWSRCGGITKFQRQRRRTVVSPPRHGGRNCTGLLVETAACGDEILQPTDCRVSAWMEWTPCTRKCGGGERMRLRTILTKAKYGGESCMTSLSQVYACSLQPCPEPPATDCRLGPWQEWGNCVRGQQRMRHRSVEAPAQGNGKACDQALTETAGCERPEEGPPNCRFSEWSEWQLCDRTCGGGQTVRQRRVAAPARPGGEACHGELRQTVACNEHPCSLAKRPCRVSTWSEWGQCSATCGAGQQVRQRKILAEAQDGGLGCYLPLTEARGCPDAEEEGRPRCNLTDCAWAEWSEWTVCSATCEGGQKRRSKHIAQEASAGGKPCEPTNTSEVAPCGMGPCEKQYCVDGKWADWGEWSACTKTCGGGYRFHSRRLEREANSCGTPAVGASTEAAQCNVQVHCSGDVDCQLSGWSEWSSCSDPCRGTRKRSREVKVHPQGSGAACGSTPDGQPLEELQTCRGAPGGAGCEDSLSPPCTLAPWEDWYNCPVTCGGGQAVRTRRVNQARRLEGSGSAPFQSWLGGGNGDPLEDDVKLCDGAVKMTKPCNTIRCGGKVDCQYGDWSDWDKCTRCGGLQFRHRQVVKAPQNGGAECSLKATNETRACDRDCGQKIYYCIWEKWSPWAPCSKSCGAGMTFRRRLLGRTEEKPDDPLVVGSSEKECTGEQIEVDNCDLGARCPNECEPQDCALGPWSEWSEPKCEGICERSRTIVVRSNECGKPCTGILNATKPCKADCENRDCKLTPWSKWSKCAAKSDQKFLFRSILVEPSSSGMGCSGPLNVTGSCVTGPDAPDDCQVSDWSEWGVCERTCGGGQQSRSRGVSAGARRGGLACEADLSQVRACSTAPCAGGSGAEELLPRDCQLGPWSLWSRCSGVGGQQAFRKRVMMHEAEAGGAPCQGRLRETRPCAAGKSSKHRNCIFSTWSMWSTCPVTCGGAQHGRSRSIEVHAKGDGLQCEGPLLESAPCSEAPCPDAEPMVCRFGEWGAWSECSATCGGGSLSRSRAIATPAPLSAKGCSGPLHELRQCKRDPCGTVVDCLWGEWGSWSDCVPAPDVCGVGYKKRSRSIRTLPSAGGRLCAPRTREEVSPVVNCQGQPQCCIDGEWDTWGEWGSCSATCGRGTRKRTRRLRVKETWCGKPAKGSDVEYGGCVSATCSSDRDCAFSEWSRPSPCSANCHGSRIRTRHILVNGTGRGKSCEGAVETAERCNPADGQPEPFSCEVHGRSPAGQQDCVMTQWSEWSGCTATCERGYQTRYRRVQTNPGRGGKSCPPSTREIASCHTGVKCFDHREDCEWGKWTAWSECNDLGEKMRSRGINRPASGFGLACQGPVKEIATCTEPGEACELADNTCHWGDWSEWSSCSATCGSMGVRQRTRHLEVGNGTEAVLRKFESGPVELQGAESGHAQRLLLAFVLGSAGLTAILLVTWGSTALVGLLSRRWETRVLEYNAIPQHP